MSTKSNFTIIIVGGGIAGLSSAIALRAPNRKIIVLEQSRLNREIGATISLQPNASKIVAQWGLAETLQASGAMRDEAFRVFSTDGELQQTISLLLSEKYGADRMVYHRQDLHDALKEHATSLSVKGDPAEIRVSSPVISCDPEKGVVHLRDGTTLKGDLIVGADGIKSTVRKSVLGYELAAKPTGFSAYRLMANIDELEKAEPNFFQKVSPRLPFTTMVMAHDRRLIMGPARNGSVYSVVALVPDKREKEDTGNSWTSQAELVDLLRDFEMFPSWAQAPFKHSKDIGLWQLRDTEPLPTWYKGRVILIGDAAHAMLPTQGQGASQAVEDAEALGDFFSDVTETMDCGEVARRLDTIFNARYDRATTIQSYSRQSAQPATAPGDVKIKMNPAQFMDYNCIYHGARRWLEQQQQESSRSKVSVDVKVDELIDTMKTIDVQT